MPKSEAFLELSSPAIPYLYEESSNYDEGKL